MEHAKQICERVQEMFAVIALGQLFVVSKCSGYDALGAAYCTCSTPGEMITDRTGLAIAPVYHRFPEESVHCGYSCLGYSSTAAEDLNPNGKGASSTDFMHSPIVPDSSFIYSTFPDLTHCKTSFPTNSGSSSGK
jgi:hypothetical protein